MALNLDNLDLISVYSYKSNFNGESHYFYSNPDAEGNKHSILSDNTQYISNRMVDEIMKKDFKDNYDSVVGKFDGALDPNMDIYNISGLSEIHTEYKTLINLMSPIYVSQLLQTDYCNNTDFDSIPKDDKLAFNSWDMIKANSLYGEEKNSEEYRDFFSKVYNIASDHTEEVDAGSENFTPAKGLKAYKDDNVSQHWGKKLYDYYAQDDKMMEVEEANIAPDDVTREISKIQNIFAKLRCLNFTDDDVTKEEIDDLEGRYFGLMIISMAETVKVGSIDKSDSFRNNLLMQDQVLEQLVDDRNTSSSKQFWRDMKSNHGASVVQDIVKSISSSLDGKSLTSLDVKKAIMESYPEFGATRSLAGETALAQLLMFCGLSHLIYSTASTDDIQATIPEMIGFAGAAYDSIKGIAYWIITRNLHKFFMDANTAQVKPFSQASKFYLNFARKMNGVGKAEKAVIEAVFMESSIVKLAEKAGLVFGVLALGASAFTLANAIMSGSVVDIIFEAVNTAISLASVTVGFCALAGVAWAGPVGMALAIVGAVVAIIQWLVDIFMPKPAPPTPIQYFTTEVINHLGFQYESNRYFYTFKEENTTNAEQIFKFYEREILFEEGSHDCITLPDGGVVMSSKAVICEDNDNLYIYRYDGNQDHSDHGQPCKSNLALTMDPVPFYDNWGQISDDILYFRSVVVVNGTSYGLAIHQIMSDIDPRMYKWQTGVNPPKSSDMITNITGDYTGGKDELKNVCKLNSRVFVFSRTRMYELRENEMNQVCQFREEYREDESSFDVKLSTQYNSIFVHSLGGYGDEKMDSLYEINVADSFKVTELLGGRTGGIPKSFGVSVFTEARKNIVTIIGNYIQRTGLLMKGMSKDQPCYLEVMGGLKYQDGDLSWNSAEILQNIQVKE